MSLLNDIVYVSYEIISMPLIGQKYECYIVIEVDELNKDNISSSSSTSMTISAVAGKQLLPPKGSYNLEFTMG